MVRTQGLILPPGSLVDLNPHDAVSNPTFMQPTVFDGAWELGPNNFALILANADPAATVSVTLPNAIGQTTLSSGMQLKKHVNGGAAVLITFTTGMTLTLAPGDVVVVRM
jgi:hypothetical protein